MLKQHAVIISQFLWASQARPWILCSVSHSSAVRGWSDLKAQLVEGAASKLITWLLAGFSSLWAVGLKASVPSLLLAACHCQFLASWTSPTWPLTSSKSERENLLERWKLQSLTMRSKKWHPIHFSVFCWLHACHRSCSCSKTGDYIKARAAGWGDSWEPF